MNNFCSEQQDHVLPKTTVILTLVMVLLFTLAGCGSGSSALVGRWVIESGQSALDVPEEMELLEDGTGIFDNFDRLKVTWKTDTHRIYFSTHFLTHKEFAYDYKISGSILTLKDDNRMITYKKAIAKTPEPKQKPDQAQSQVQQFNEGLGEYHVDTGTYPTMQQGGLQALLTRPTKMTGDIGNDVIALRANLAVEKWKGPYLKVAKLPTDPWGNEYYYEYPTNKTVANTPAVWSSGPDKISGNDDDIRNWDPREVEFQRAQQARFGSAMPGGAMSGMGGSMTGMPGADGMNPMGGMNPSGMPGTGGGIPPMMPPPTGF